MFIHKNQLRQQLRADRYVSDEQYRAELRHLFEPTWHLVATTDVLARPGDFVSFELLGRPLLVRNMDGEIRAFLNVCPHRHSRLTSEARGHSARLRCQYHGWEYNAEGRTGKIPDAQSFRPFDRENSCLKRFRVATCGALVFVSLADAGLTLEEYLGPLHPHWLASFSRPFRLAGWWEEEFACNWKVVVENSLESYHIPCVHPNTFRRYPREENCSHVLDERYTTFQTKHRRTWKKRARSWVVRRLGGQITPGYEHQNVHPHLTLSSLDVSRLAMVVYPLSATTCRYRMYAFSLAGRRGLLAPVLSRVLRGIVVRVARRVFAEDGSIYEAVQQGLAASPHPGVIGTREERIYAFQQFINRTCGLPDLAAEADGQPAERAKMQQEACSKQANNS